MTATDILQTVRAYGARLVLDEDGDLAVEGNDPPAQVVALVRAHRQELVALLGNADISDPIVDDVLAKFGATVVAIVKPGEPAPTEFKEAVQNWPQPTAGPAWLPEDCWPWVDQARRVLGRNWDAEPADAAEVKSLSIGLKAAAAKGSALCDHALRHLAKVRPRSRGRKDAQAGKLLPRVPNPKHPQPAPVSQQDTPCL
jgi:hypothetical protein